MELLAPEAPEKFDCGNGVVFLVKTRASEADRFQLGLSRESRIKNGIAWFDTSSIDFGLMLIKLFVVGWEGVTSGGNPVPYSFDLLMSSFPADKKKSPLLDLAAYILKNVDIFQADAGLKKNLPPPSNGSAASGPSTAAGETAKK